MKFKATKIFKSNKYLKLMNSTALHRRIGLRHLWCPLVAACSVYTAAEASNVDTELVILVDAQTYSQSDFNLILEGVASSFEQPDFYTSVTLGGFGKIASSVMLFNVPGEQVGVTWTELTTQQDFFNFAQSVRNIAYPNTGGNVSYASALTSAAAHFNASPSDGTVQQITLIDDATGFWQVNPGATQAARDGALASGVDVINAMVFDAAYQETAVTNYYNANIVSPNGTVAVVSTPQGGPKSNAEISLATQAISATVAGPTLQAVPEPSSSLLMVLSGSLLLGYRRRASR